MCDITPAIELTQPKANSRHPTPMIVPRTSNGQRLAWRSTLTGMSLGLVVVRCVGGRGIGYGTGFGAVAEGCEVGVF